MSDVPVGVFLSGGIDSALVAASVAASGAKLKTFTVGFDGASAYYEERPDAAAVARHLGAEHTEIGVSAEPRVRGARSRLPRLSTSRSPMRPRCRPFWCRRRPAEQVTVVLTGDGADEVFGGYRRYWSELHAASWQRVPAPLRRSIAAVLARMPEGKDSRLLEWSRRARRFVTTADPDPVRRQAGWMRMLAESELDSLLGPAPTDPVSVEHLIGELRTASRSDDPINAMLAATSASGLPGDMLVKVDRTSMAHALETRTPFLDQRVVEWAFALPGSQKLALSNGRAIGKRILRTAFRDRLPAEVFNRPKRGFEMPVAAMLKGAARERLAAATDPAALARQGLFDSGLIRSGSDDLDSGRRDTSWQLWTVLAFQEWARLHRRPEALS